jgi:tRNA uridine 5-carboxymethylaminomethyl modification enzyme
MQAGDEVPVAFSYMNSSPSNAKNQIDCYLTRTQETTHEIIRRNLHKSPNFVSGDGKVQLYN